MTRIANNLLIRDLQISMYSRIGITFMKIGIDIRTLMDAQYSGVSEYTLNLIQNILKLDQKNDYRLFYNSAHDISNRIPRFDYPNVKIIKFNYPNKILNYIGFKMLGMPRIDKLLDVDVFFMPHINFMAFSGKAKSILTVHDLSFLRYGEFFSLRKNFWHRMLNVKKISYIQLEAELTKGEEDVK